MEVGARLRRRPRVVAAVDPAAAQAGIGGTGDIHQGMITDMQHFVRRTAQAAAGFVKEACIGFGGAVFAGTQLEAEAAQQYRSMAEAAQADGITLMLVTGYQDADTRTAAYEAQKQTYLARHKSEEEASARAAAILPEADANEHGTGYAADILSTDYTAQDTGFADTRAYQWLTAYAAEYGFILRYPEDRQAITGVVFEPWHWRYVGVENALAIRASGLSLEEFLAEQKAL